MLALFTGLPGAGKTLNLIKYILENKDYENRTFYYYGINECKVEGWRELTEEQLRKWYELDDSPVIIIDEVQKIWRKRGTSSAIPFEVQELETHRHLGIDIFMTSQNPMQIDHEVRSLIQMHWHYDRVANLNTGRRYEFERCIADPYKDRHLAIQTSRYNIDKKYFGLYKSAEVHTHGRRIPKKLYLVVSLLFICSVFIWYALDTVLFSRTERVEEMSSSSPGIQDTNFVSDDQSIDPYLLQFKKRYDDLPFSSPIYDELVKANSYPYVSGCSNIKINDVNNCTCNSLQGNTINIPEDYCLSFIANGQHNYSLSDQEIKTAMTKYLPTGEPCCGSSGNENSEQDPVNN